MFADKIIEFLTRLEYKEQLPRVIKIMNPSRDRRKLRELNIVK